ncbi:MAG: T9SS type A sorting domain-containing protein [Flavobacteriales bacterium]|nr:T9SS type A sorting domain-containing protein [Flavobacteriales bacterium]
MNAEQATRLREIAQLCPLDDGMGVYIARSALLKLDTLPRHYTSECERMPDQQAIDSWKNGMEDTTHMEFSVYPNPNNGSFAINYQLNDRESGTVLLFNALGEVVYQRQLDASTTAMNVAINGLSSGIYVLRVDVDGSHRLVERITVLLSKE